MINLRETYRWIDEFNDKKLTLPSVAKCFIEIAVDSEKCDHTADEHAQFRTNLPFARSECFAASIIDVKQLINNEDDKDIKNVYELTLQLKNKVLEYWPGDTIGVLPANPDETVHKIFDRCSSLKSKSNQPIRLSLSSEASQLKKVPKIPMHLPAGQTTLLKLFKECVDLYGFPKKAFLAALVSCVSDPIERRFLEILASREGSTLYATEILQKQTTFYILFHTLQSMSFTIENVAILFEHLPRLMPRPYSISNSPLTSEKHPEYSRQSTILKIIFSLIDPPGITTQMLQNQIFKYQVESTLELSKNESTVNLYARTSNRFQLTDSDLNRPLIMVAIGTGVAPFIGFLEHHREQLRKHSVAESKPFTWLLFGCRRKTKQLCGDLLQDFVADGTLAKFSECFSKDAKVEVKYVQDLIRLNAQQFIELLVDSDDGTAPSKTFVCGNKKMATDVRAVIEESLIKVGKCSAIEDAKRIIDELVKSGRYVEDIWI